jgi:cytochrome P450
VSVNPFLATGPGERVAAYAAMAAAGPVLKIPSPGGGEAWFVTGYAEARAVLNDPRLVKAPPPGITPLRRERLARAPWITSHMLVRDGAEHERLRRLVMAAFTRRRIEALEPSIRAIADALLDDLAQAGKDGSPANRDPAQHDDPEVLDVTREPRQHLAFGHGIHHCLGVTMARLEARIAFETLQRRFPRLELAVPPQEPAWEASFLFHGLAALPVRLGDPG